MIEIIDLLKPKNGGSFKLIEDIDIAVSGYSSLADCVAHMATTAMIEAINAVLSGKQDKLTTAQLTACNSGITSELVAQITANATAIAGKADAADLTALETEVDEKADSTDLSSATTNLQAQIDALVTPVTQDAEVQNARVGADGSSYTTLKSRLDTENAALTTSISNNTDRIDNIDSSIIIESKTITKWADMTIVGDYYIKANGIKTASSYFRLSDFIRVKAGDTVTASGMNLNIGGTTIYGIACYDKNKQFISGEGLTGSTTSVSGSFTVPAQAAYIVISDQKTSSATFSIKSYSYEVGKAIEDLQDLEPIVTAASSDISDLQANTLTFKKEIQSWEDLTVAYQGYVIPDGRRVASNYLKTSNYIRVKTGDTVTATNLSLNIGGNTIFGVSCYDINKNFIANTGITGSTNEISGTFTVSGDIAYIAISELVDDVSSFAINEYTANIGEQVTENTKAIFPPVLSGRKIVNFGDSLFGNYRAPNDISTFLANMTNATVYNCGFGGCNMGQHASSSYDPFCMYRIADAIADNDWTLQDAAIEDTSLPNYFANTLTLLKSIDFSEVDICTISYGTNDFSSGLVPDSEKTGQTRFYVFSEALAYSIETLLTAFPNLRIFVITPHYRFWLQSSEFLDDSNTHEVQSGYSGQNYKLTDFVKSAKDTAKKYQIPVIDDYYDLGFNKFNRSVYYPVADGTHPNATGRRMIAEHIAHCLY